MNKIRFFAFFLTILTLGCDYNPGYGGPGTPGTSWGSCNEAAPWGSEYCPGDLGLPGSNLLRVRPSEATSSYLELNFSFRGGGNSSWVEHSQTVVLNPDFDGVYAVTMPGAPPDGDVEVAGALIFEGVTSKEVFCRNTEWGVAEIYFGLYKVQAKTDTGCVLSWSNDRLE